MADKATVESSSKLLPRALAPYNIVTLRENSLSIIVDEVEGIISMECATRAPGLNTSHHVNTDKDNFPKDEYATLRKVRLHSYSTN